MGDWVGLGTRDARKEDGGMTDEIDRLAVYLHLARASEMRQRLHVRDRLLVLSSALAARAGLPRIAEYCRQRVLRHNPKHLIQRWNRVEDAVRDPEFVHFLRHLEQRYPPENAEGMLSSLGVDRARERETYYNDEEYAAALLGTSQEQLTQLFGSRP